MLKSQTAHSLLLERKVNQLSFIVNALNERITNIYDTCSDNDDSEYDNIMEIQKSSQEIRDGIDKVLIKQEQFISNYVNSYVP
jgi:regulator of sigma D